ncbi:MAG: ABC transporter permease subunit [Rhodobacteraceae bacterium]|nr:ABC transporter permease subunit [Paracoccaceae bacterium]
MQFYGSFGIVMLLLVVTVPFIMVFGFLGALARRSGFAPFRWFGLGYTSMVRGVPDIAFFLFVPIALDQFVEFSRHKIKCSDSTEPIYQGNDFVVCAAAKMPLGSAPQFFHEAWGFTLAVVAFAIVFGAFAANTIHGALMAVPKGQLETARAYGMNDRQTFWRVHMPQMWVYALPGLSNLWQILIKATPLLFLLGIEEIVYWARELGGAKTGFFTYPHPDWRMWYFMALLFFYVFLTWASQKAFIWLEIKLARGMTSRTTGVRA